MVPVPAAPYRWVMTASEFIVRLANADDFELWVTLYEAVASEGKWIGGEVPVDRERMRRGFEERLARQPETAAMFAARAGSELAGQLGIETQNGVAEFGMMVAADWRGRNVGPALMDAAIGWARGAGAHKVTLQVWPHNHRAQALYRRFGFVEEGRLRRHYRRRNGELWDALVMGYVLDDASPGSPFGAER